MNPMPLCPPPPTPKKNAVLSRKTCYRHDPASLPLPSATPTSRHILGHKNAKRRSLCLENTVLVQGEGGAWWYLAPLHVKLFQEFHPNDPVKHRVLLCRQSSLWHVKD